MYEYEIFAEVSIPTYVPYFPCAEKLVGFYTVAKFDDEPLNQTAIIEQHIQEITDKLLAAGYKSREICSGMANEGSSCEFGYIDVNEEHMIIQGRSKWYS